MPTWFHDRVIARVAMARRHTFLLLSKRAEAQRGYFADSHLPARICATLDRIARSDRADGADVDAHAAAFNLRSGRQPWPLANLQIGVSIEDRARLPRLDALSATPAALRWVSFEPLLEHLGAVDLAGIGWGVIGGESGCAAAVRRFDLQWARALLEQHRAAGIPCFVKQLGSQPWLGKRLMIELADRKGGDPAEWPRDLRVREYPRVDPEPVEGAIAGGQSATRSVVARSHGAKESP